MTSTTYSAKVGFGGSSPISIQLMNNQVDAITVTGGSIDGFDQPQPTTFSCQFLNPVFAGFTILPADLIGLPVTLQLQANVDGTLTGTIDFANYIVQSADMMALDSAGENNLLTFTAVSPMAALSRFVTDRSNHVSESELDRIDALTADMEIQWNDISGAIVWSDYPSDFTWNDFAFISPTVGFGFGTPRTLIATTATNTNALQFFQNMADVNGAWLYDYQNGAINYDPLNYWAAGTPTALDASVSILGQNLETSLDISDRYNNVTITNGTSTGYASDPVDIIANGEYPLDLTSYLSTSGDLELLADYKVQSHATGIRTLTRMTIDLDTLTTALDLYTLANITYPHNLTISNIPTYYLPSGLNSDSWQMRGATLSWSYNHAEIDAVVLPYAAYNTASETWTSVSVSWNWTNYKTAATKWQDIN